MPVELEFVVRWLVALSSTLMWTRRATVKSLKLLLGAKSKELGCVLPMEQHRLLFSGRWMDDDAVLGDCRIDSGSKLLLMKSGPPPPADCADAACALVDIDVLRCVDEDACLDEIDSADREEPSTRDQEARILQSDVTACWRCARNIGLTGIRCRCGYHFCAEHRYAECHNCDFDHVSYGRDLLRKELG